MHSYQFVDLIVSNNQSNASSPYDFTIPLLEKIKATGRRYMFMTNNSSKSVADYIKKLEKMGIVATREDFITSSQATAYYLKKHHPGKTLYVCGTRSLVKELEMEGLLLVADGQILAMTMGSRLSKTTFDIHFEKALDRVDGAYPTINQAFARYLREKYPELLWLDREDDMGLEGLRKAKLSYCPDHMIEKHWACLLEDGYDY